MFILDNVILPIMLLVLCGLWILWIGLHNPYWGG